ncbi:hypothetical protein E2C01_009799 [Portunus trituberculatus]|uniref:Uncharacterized protein n=1 Tax=Portunus trituberculatus TaxID=210409 RepID=A0A5B7D6Z6_PORTR|nr:hypothetical protein [Portunus trituberculatus]
MRGTSVGLLGSHATTDLRYRHDWRRSETARHRDMGPDLDIHNPESSPDQPLVAWGQRLSYSAVCRSPSPPFPTWVWRHLAAAQDHSLTRRPSQ